MYPIKLPTVRYSFSIILFFISFQLISQKSEAKLTYEKATKLYQNEAPREQDKSAAFLRYVEKYSPDSFVSKKDYFDFILLNEKELRESPSIENAKICFLISKALQLAGRKHEAYEYIDRTASILKKTDIEKVDFAAEFYEIIGNYLYYFRRNEQAKDYFFKALKTKNVASRAKININNSIGLIYRDKDDTDSSIYYFNRALKIAQNNKDLDWTGVITGNLGYAYYQKGDMQNARKLFEIDKEYSIRSKEYASALSATCFLMTIDLQENNLKAAAENLNLASSLLGKDHNPANAWNYYKSKTEFLEKKGDYKGAYEAFRKSIRYKDTMVQQLDLVNFQNNEFQINFQKKRAENSLLKERKKSAEMQIIYLYIFIGMAIIAFSVILNQIIRRKKRDKEILLLQKLRIQEELKNTEKELRLILQNMIEKNQLIEDLSGEIEVFNKDQNDLKSIEEKEKLIDRLQSFTLLTEDDLIEFRRLFEKLNPGFSDFLTDNYKDLTNAEIRLAMLIKLNLNNLEMSKTLGISPDSVRKTNLRLRKKLDIEHQDELVSFIKNIATR